MRLGWPIEALNISCSDVHVHIIPNTTPDMPDMRVCLIYMYLVCPTYFICPIYFVCLIYFSIVKLLIVSAYPLCSNPTFSPSSLKAMEMVTTRAVSGNTFGNDAKVLLGNITHNITTINSGIATLSDL